MNNLKYLIYLFFLVKSVDSLGQCQNTLLNDTYSVCLGDSVAISVNPYILDTTPIPYTWTTTFGNVGIYCTPSPTNTTFYWASTSNTTPSYQVNPVDVSCGGIITFYMIYAIQGGAIPCEGPDRDHEGVTLEYSIDNGSTWTSIVYYNPHGYEMPANPMTPGTSLAVGTLTPYTSWNLFSVPIPQGAMTNNTMFRWNQYYVSGTCCDNWGLDDVNIYTGCNSSIVNWSTGDLDTSQIVVSPDIDSIYIAEFIDTSGSVVCVDTAFVNVVLPQIQYDSVQVCYESSYTFPDGTFIDSIQSSLTYSSFLNNSLGCDSTIVTSLEIDYPDTINLQANICFGGDFTFPNNSVYTDITSNINHTSILTNSSGCDSLVIISLSVNPQLIYAVSDSVCFNGSYTYPDGTISPFLTSDTIQYSYLEGVEGCDSVVVSYLTVIPNHSVTVYDTICVGTDYVFPDGSIVTDIQSDIIQSSSLISSLGCDSIVSSEVTVTLVNVDVLQMDSLLFASNPNGSYSWMSCDNGFQFIPGANNQSFVPIVSGSYAVQISENGCVDTSACYSAIADLNEIYKNSYFVAYPNPTSNVHTVLFDEVQEQIDVYVYDNFGKLCLHNQSRNTNNVKFDLEVSKGIYRVEVRTNIVFESYPLVYFGE